MPKQKRSISFAKQTMQFVDNFPSRQRGMGNFTTRAEEIINDYAVLLDRTKQELNLTEPELDYIYDMLCNVTVQMDLPIRIILAASVTNAGQTGEKGGVNPGALSNKILGLTEFQAYALLKKANEHWDKKE